MNFSPTDQTQIFWDRWYSPIYGYFYKRVNNQADVEDLTSSTLTGLLLNPKVLGGQIEKINGYVWKVAHNHLVKYINTKASEPTLVSVEDIENQASWIPPEQEIELSQVYSQNYLKRSQELMECTNNYLEDLIDKKLIYMSMVDDLNSTQIGLELDLKPDTVRQKLRRLITKIRINCLTLWLN
ncbi:MAG: sigma-70 family RNA polymerase sigma factor [Candidatus Parcubacteria bacterium]|nr:sigma-70 family RNA polymerase sigma factor [Candidatus Paceibacterota bacterium]